jgi:hypothetical protein
VLHVVFSVWFSYLPGGLLVSFGDECLFVRLKGYLFVGFFCVGVFMLPLPASCICSLYACVMYFCDCLCGHLLCSLVSCGCFPTFFLEEASLKMIVIFLLRETIFLLCVYCVYRKASLYHNYEEVNQTTTYRALCFLLP